MLDSYASIRDTIRVVSGKAAILQRDARSASDPVLFSRARSLTGACDASLRHLDRTRHLILSSDRAERAPAPRRTALDRSAIALRAELMNCTGFYREITRDRVRDMRGKGVTQALKTQGAIRDFEGAAEAYLLSVGIKVRPHGSGTDVYAGSARRAD